MRSDFIYGTAWKEEHTKNCVVNALETGYRAIDTANQRKHYYEKGVGDAISFAKENLGIKREDIFLQTKFTYLSSQDDRLPYDKNAKLTTQVKQSFQSSLEHLQTDYLDSFILHGPSNPDSFLESDWEVWNAMEKLNDQKKIKYLGVSNISYKQLVTLYEQAGVRPSFVQNRCYAAINWDEDIRNYCRDKNIHYQGFSILTGSRQHLGGTVLRPNDRTVPQLVLDEYNIEVRNIHPAISEIINQTGRSISQIMYRFAQQVGIIPLTGTRSKEHMISNLQIANFELTSLQINKILNLESPSKSILNS